VPAAERFVKEGNLIIRVDAPGVEPDDDVEWTVLDNVLRLGKASGRSARKSRRLTTFIVKSPKGLSNDD